MGKVIRVIRKTLFIVAGLLCIGITLYNEENIPIETNGTIFVVDKYADTYYEMLSDNVGLTTINGISNVFLNMQADGYSIYNQEVTTNYIDVSFIKEGFPSYRYYYTHPEGRITFFSDDYENSYSGLAYITERK